MGGNSSSVFEKEWYGERSYHVRGKNRCRLVCMAQNKGEKCCCVKRQDKGEWRRRRRKRQGSHTRALTPSELPACRITCLDLHHSFSLCPTALRGLRICRFNLCPTVRCLFAPSGMCICGCVCWTRCNFLSQSQSFPCQ